MDHTSLDVAKLSPAAQKALGPGPARMMASRGMVPLSPGDQISVLYQLAIDKDQTLQMAARATAIGLPDNVLAGALADPKVDARVLDLFATLVGSKAAAFEALVANAATADQTIAALAEHATMPQLERISANEQRLLRHPEIIAAMYTNRQARMSTIDRIVELAVRNNVRVPGLAVWDEIARALQGGPPPPSPEADAAFAAAVEASAVDDSAFTQGDAEQVEQVIAESPDGAAPEGDAELPPEVKDVPIEKLSVPAKVRLCLLGNGFQRAVLVRDPLKMVALAAIKSPAVTEFEAARYASNSGLAEDVIRYIAGKREWTKLYGTKVALCRNPKTPVPEAMRLMPFLREKDLVNLTKSKGIASAVAAQARKLLMQRRGGGKH